MFSFYIAYVKIKVDQLPNQKYLPFIIKNTEFEANLSVKFFDKIDFDISTIISGKKDVYWVKNADCFQVYIADIRNKLIYMQMIFSKDLSFASINRIFSNDFYAEYSYDLCIFFYFQLRLLSVHGICLHSAAIEWEGKGILFSAPSGTGKSTQAALWVKHENAEIINGDRPAITIANNFVEVHGTPWSGSDPIIRNASVPVTCIVMLEQSIENELVKLNHADALNMILPRFFIPYFDEKLTALAFDIIEKIIQMVPIYKLRCRPDEGAVEILKKELSLLEE